MEISSTEVQRIFIKFLTKLGNTPTKILMDLNTVYGGDFFKKKTAIHKWVTRFKERRRSA